MTLHFAIVLLALVCFFISAVAVPVPRLNLVALGLFFWLLSVVLK